MLTFMLIYIEILSAKVNNGGANMGASVVGCTCHSKNFMIRAFKIMNIEYNKVCSKPR
jgi:hypothetical protein